MKYKQIYNSEFGVLPPLENANSTYTEFVHALMIPNCISWVLEMELSNDTV